MPLELSLACLVIHVSGLAAYTIDAQEVRLACQTA